MSEQGITPTPAPSGESSITATPTASQSAPPASQADDLAHWSGKAVQLGAGGIVVVLLAAVLPGGIHAIFRGWLMGFNFVLGIAAGSLVLLMLQYTVGGNWGFAMRRPLEAATRTFPVLFLLFLPLSLDLILPQVMNDPDSGEQAYHPALYEWSDPVAVQADHHLQHKAPYLNVWFTFGRVALYFAIWAGLAAVLNGWSRKQDTTQDPGLSKKCEAVSAPGMVLYALTVTFFSIDFVMSLEPHWYSTIYGAMFGIGQVLSAFAFATFMSLALATRPPLDRAVVGQNRRDLGSLMLAFVMVWAYLSISQFLLIWSGNLPEETPWYIARLEHGWSWVALALVLLHFFLPFFLLLSADLKRDRKALLRVALLVLVMRVVDLVWLIIPAFAHHTRGEADLQPILDVGVSLVAVVGVGGIWLAAYLSQLRKLPLLPLYNPDGVGVVHGQAAH